MKKALLLTPLAVLALASCTDNEFLGSEEAQHTINGDKAILFESGTAALTRATYYGGKKAADDLGHNYVVFGVKGDGTTKTKVFDHYNVNWKEGTANSTETNVADWEYVGFDPYRPTDADGNVAGLPTGAKQSIKYWDYSVSQYDFAAFSYGTSSSTALTLSPIDMSKLGNDGVATGKTDPVYTVKGNVADLVKAYVSNLETVYKERFSETVTPHFRRLGTKVRIAIYETVAGYAVKNVKFYYSNSRKNLSKVPVLYAVKKVTNSDGHDHNVPVKSLPDLSGKGTINVYFPTVGSGNQSESDYNKAHIIFKGSTSTDPASDLTSILKFKDLKYNTESEGILSGEYLGQTSQTATYATESSAENAYELVLPYGAGADLKLHVDYTLVSTDGSGEEINVKSASAIVPSVYTEWQPNYAYTYIFKISKNSNGTTGTPSGTDPSDPDPTPSDPTDPDPTTPEAPDDPTNPIDDPTDPDTPDPNNPAGLYPITFDAVVMDYLEGIQETITTVSDPSITTYSKGVQPTAASEYKTGENIYICLENPGTATLTTANSKLYTVTVDDEALQKIDEGSVANAIKNGKPYKVKDVAVGDDVSALYTYNAATKTYVACASDATAVAGTKYFEKDDDILAVYDAAGKAMIVTNSNLLSIETEIAAADATDGNAVSGNFAMFKPSAAGTYVFEYDDGTKKHYKIIIVHD